MTRVSSSCAILAYNSDDGDMIVTGAYKAILSPKLELGLAFCDMGRPFCGEDDRKDNVLVGICATQ
jgi:hypothetical protein